MEKLEKIIKNKILIYTLFIILMLGFVISLCPKAMQNDVFWSIKVGEKLVKEGVWEIDPFSWHEGLKYIAHHFLTDVVIYLVYLIGDFAGLYLLEIILAIIMAALLYVLNNEICKNKLLSYFFLAIQMLLLSQFIAVRAQMISYVLFIIELILLEKSRKNEKKWYYIILGIIPIILANFHMGVVPFYFIILGVYIIDTFKIKLLWIEPKTKPDSKRFKKLLILFIIGLTTIFINPYGIEGVLYPFKTLGNSVIISYISEFQPFSLEIEFAMYVLLYIFMMILIFITNKETVDLKDVLLVLGTLFMNFYALRYISLYVICSVVILKYLKNVLLLLNLDKSAVLVFSFAGIMCIFMLCGEFFINREKEYLQVSVAPEMAVQVLKQNITEDSVIFNQYEWGGYMIFNNIPVFIDSRCDLYTAEYNPHTQVAKDYMNLRECTKEYNEILNKYNFDIFLIKTETPLAVLLGEIEEYEKIYEDSIATIYKNGE